MNQTEASEICRKILEEGNGYFLIRDVEERGVQREYAYRFLADSILQKAAKGIYYDPVIRLDEIYVISLRHKGAVFSHESALYIHGYLEKEELPRIVTVPVGYHSDLIREKDVAIVQVKKELLDTGLIYKATPEGHIVRTYDLERTICDMVKKRNQLDPERYQKILRRYFSDPSRDLIRLQKYSNMFRVRKLMDMYVTLLV